HTQFATHSPFFFDRSTFLLEPIYHRAPTALPSAQGGSSPQPESTVIMGSQIRRPILGFAAYFALLGLVVPLPTSSQEPEPLKPTKNVFRSIPKSSSTRASAAR